MSEPAHPVLLAEGALRRLPEVLRRTSGLPPVIVAGRSSFDLSGARALIDEVLGRSVPVFHVEARQPELADFTRFRDRFEGGSFSLVAVGGGHVIDTAKLISTDARDAKDVRDRLAGRQPFRRVMPLIAAPTTTGSGSEVTPFAVIYLDGIKHSIDHPSLKPDAALIDPTLMVSLEQRQIAASGLDVLAQSIEALLSRGATVESDRLARRALSLGWPSLPRLHAAREPAFFAVMAEAANLAGQAIAITRTTLPHALSYYFTRRFGVPHGHAVALSMGPYLALLGERMACGAHGLERWRDPYAYVLDVMGVRSGADVASRWTAYVEALSLEATPARLGIGPDDLSMIHHEINSDRLANAPITLSKAEIDRLWTAT